MQDNELRRLLAGGLAMGFLAVTVGCGEGVDAEALDQHHAGDARFYGRLANPGGLEAEIYKSLEKATRSVGAVAVAEVVDVRFFGTEVGDAGAPDDKVAYAEIELRPIELLNGELADKYRERLSFIHVIGGGDPEREVEVMRSHLPDGPAVWFLRNRADFTRQLKGREPRPEEVEGPPFWIATSLGVFIQGEEHVENPLMGNGTEENPWRPPMVEEAASYDRLSELVEHLRGIDGWHGKIPEELTN